MSQDLMSPDEHLFADLPAALVEEILEKTSDVAQDLLGSFHYVRENRRTLRSDLERADALVTESSLGYPPLPTTCAADGSYAIERLLTTDLVAAAAVVTEGLAPPPEKRHWDMPRHTCFMAAEPHRIDTSIALRGVMMGEELCLITKAPHDLRMLDGSMTLPMIYFNQALSMILDMWRHNLRCGEKFLENCIAYLRAYLSVLRSEHLDKNYIALPKYTTRREIGREMSWQSAYDDRGMLSMLLNPGELTKPRVLEQRRDSDRDTTLLRSLSSLRALEQQRDGDSARHSPTRQLIEATDQELGQLADGILSALESVQVFYYKPQDWLPALRVEVSAAVASNPYRLATVVQGLKYQTATPAMLEPYPIYLADRTVKALARAIPAFRQVTMQRISEGYGGDIGEVYFAMRGYRSESGA